jgi:membrane protein YdbS with pleckstrin-like domain
LSDPNATLNVAPEFTNNIVDCQQITTEELLVSRNPFFTLPDELQPLVKWAYAAILVITLWNFIYHYLADPLKQYALREHDLNYQSGLIFRSLVSQPILRIQHIEIKRGPIERKAGLATLQVFSAGGVSHTFNIPGLEYDKAVSLRQFILDHKDLAADV